MKRKEYKMDRSELKSMTFQEAEDHSTYYANKSEVERLNAACFIINQIFGTSAFTKVDLTITAKRKHINV